MNQNVENRGDVLLKKWLDGSITWQEERELEQLAQGDALLADALDGFRAMPEGNHTQPIARIKARLQERTQRKQRGLIFYLPRMAAAAAIVAALAVGIWFLNGKENAKSEIANQQPEVSSPQVETIEPAVADVEQNTASNESITLQDQVTNTPAPARERTAIAKPTLPLADPTRVESLSDTSLSIAESDIVVAEETPPAAAAKKAEIAPPSPSSYERSQAAGTARTLTATPTRTITGKVTDTNGEPLIGASVVVPGTNQGTVSDVEGRFKIELPKGKELLMISYAGYDAKEVRLDASDTVNLQLQPGGTALEEVVVTGLGKTKAQKETENKDTPQVRIRSELSITRQPEPRGGFDKFKQYIIKNLRYPKVAREAGIEGEVAVAFKILPNGNLTEFQILKSLGYGLDEEAIRLLKQGPKWEMSDPIKGKETGAYLIEFKLKK
ncbi:MAG: TonB family protein [Saprospiraceae bacterium]